ncbi:PDZ domain-containing protein [Halosquirtibacter xylanolyticus]|uniref:S41 family peptidase n=1 Tax=Halosquirtibacter xylanolyticus TaxID=3374599 RepID=UPI0037486303|nr:PDZ domain-containing protein [Prolixibacteraceae bacterium]
MIRRLLLLSMMVGAIIMQGQAKEARLMRFPDIHQNQVVFSYAGNLYTVDSSGGTARQLTSDIGYEMFAHFSPTGKQIAFTAQYDGNTEVYLMNADGGVPQRLTFTPTLKRDDIGDRMGPNNIVMGWTPNGKEVIFRSRWQTGGSFTGQLYRVNIQTKEIKQLPLEAGGFCSYNAAGDKLAMNKVFREFRTWKYYEGGMADDIWIYDTKKGEVDRIVKNNNQDIIPMWIGDKIFYLSDRDRATNLFAYDTQTKQDKKLTNFTDYDIRFPGFDKKNIVFTKGGYLMRYDVASGKTNKINVDIQNDQIYARSSWYNYGKEIQNVSLANQGQRLLVEARGELFSVPVKEGVTYNLTNNSKANDRSPAWSPDGHGYAYVSDKDGEFRVWYHDVKQDQERCLTPKIKSYLYGLEWSPDSKKIALSDKNNDLYYIDVDKGKIVKVAHSDIRIYRGCSWSPDSRWITYVEPNKPMDRIAVYSLDNKKTKYITDGWSDVGDPSFSLDGKSLLFSTRQNFSPTYSQTEWNHAYTNMNNICIFLLNKDAVSPFEIKNDPITTAKKDKDAKVGTDKKSDKKKDDKLVTIDFDNPSDRMVMLPTKAGSYWSIYSDGKFIYYNRYRSGEQWSVYAYNIAEKKETKIGKFSWGPTSDMKQFVLFNQGRIKVVKSLKAPVKMDKTVDLSQMQGTLNLHQEWMQIYNECWRQMRDFFYAKNMHGVDWQKIHDKYEQLVPYVNHRSDLTFVIGEMIGELNVGHAYSANGKHPEPKRIYGGYLGAKVEKAAQGYFQIKEIMKAPKWNQKLRSPLTTPGLDVHEGDYIIAVNQKSVSNLGSIYQGLVGQANKTVALTINNKPTSVGARTIYIKPLASEDELYYYNWVQNNIDKVNKATNGKVGYIHIPDMGVNGLNMFARLYYPQLQKKGLIVDDRFNGGGNVSPMITERLKRTPTFYTMHTNEKEGDVSPVGTHVGPKVLLCNGYSASDGDLFPYRFRKNKLGTIIGTRTWGGVVGYSGSIRCVDGGHIVTPSYAPFATDGSEFIIEGRGVTPDIIVENDPHKEFNGEDAQLNKAIEVVLKQVKNNPPKHPAIPKFPNKTK